MTDRDKGRVMSYLNSYTGYKRRASTEQAQYAKNTNAASKRKVERHNDELVAVISASQ